MRRGALFGLCLGLAACSRRAEPGSTVIVELPLEPSWDPLTLRVEPARAELARTRTASELTLRIAAGEPSIALAAVGACRRTLTFASPAGAAPVRTSLEPLFDLGARERVVGVDAAFELRALPRCAEANAARVSIAVRGGAPLASGMLSADGRTFSGRTQRLAPRAAGNALGVVPVSRAAQLDTELGVELQIPGQKPLSYALRVSALARASGLPNVALGHPLLVAGAGVTLSAPAGSRAALRDVGGLLELVPDVRGSYALADAAGRQLTIESARYDQVPLDCGRAECHQAIAASSRESPMTRALASDLGGCHPLSQPSCALACHATGEPGTADGGFWQIARELEQPALPSEYAELPRALQRAGGVGCLACHGPSAIPRPTESWALLRSDVCAVCHDAPPRYGHVAAFASSRMAHSDRDPRARGEAGCAVCHTTAGALADARRAPPDGVESFGLGCATCHDVHPHEVDRAPTSEPEPSLLRDLPITTALRDLPASLRGVSRVCVPCHAPTPRARLPEASAAAILAGRGGLAPDTGEPLNAAAPHAGDTKGCLTCHDSSPPSVAVERGRGHGFAADRQRCAACHAPKAESSFAERGRALREQLAASLDASSAGASGAQPAHARRAAAFRATAPTARDRALYDVELVLEDPAAAIHNPGYARLLLDAAQAVASTLPGRKP